MRIKVEFFGIPRSRSGVTEQTLEISAENPTLGALLQALYLQFPGLRQNQAATNLLDPSLAINLNGERFVREETTPLKTGDVILLMSADAGG